MISSLYLLPLYALCSLFFVGRMQAHQPVNNADKDADESDFHVSSD